jgi:hypothetical protein
MTIDELEPDFVESQRRLIEVLRKISRDKID